MTPASAPVSRQVRPATRVARAWAAQNASSPLAPSSIERREPLADDVVLDILYCGVCHSDLHQVRNEWNGSIYPVVPGHEIVGRVARVGSGVTKFREGDIAAVGCLVDSCQHCEPCAAGLEQYCTNGCTLTYNSPDAVLGGPTFGGYSESITVRESFTLAVPPGLDPAAAAPLLCAGIATYSPLRHWQVGPGARIGIVGLGGLGHMGVKFARAFGAHVVLFTTSAGKAEDGLRLGAHEVVVSKDAAAMARHASSLDFAGSGIGGIRETQEMLDFCAEHGIVSDIELISIDQINSAYDRMLRSEVRYRFVIDMASLKA